MARQVLDEGQLLDLATHPQCRRKGLSGILMNELLRKLRDNSCLVIYLEVRASNEPAISLYKKYGFETISTRKDYYKKPVEDALIMKLEIK
jgi:ribosomal-protein-alanine N-acetyltransferase